jgi:hypothetical protein
MLPDDVLLETFDFYLGEIQRIGAWQSLVHVCRRWRRIIFGSPRRLNMRLVCTPKSPGRNKLDVWPSLPLVIQGRISSTSDADNTVALLEHRDRVCKIDLDAPSPQLERVLAATQEPFPELTDLLLRSDGTAPLVLPDPLRRAVPRLRDLLLNHISVPGLPKLLLSSAHLVHLHLCDIPYSECISPEAIIACPSTLIGLKTLQLAFRSPLSHSEWKVRRRPPSTTRLILTSLNRIEFKGLSEYLEDLVARIDAPQLCDLHITFFNQLIFDTPELVLFIGRTPKLNATRRAEVGFSSHAAFIILSSLAPSYGELSLRVSCRGSDWQLSCLAQICASLSPSLTPEALFIVTSAFLQPDCQEDVEKTQWLQVLHPFAAVKHLYPTKLCVSCIALALQELTGDRTTEVLPALKNIYLQRPQERSPGLPPGEEGIRRFVAARQLIGHPVAVLPFKRHSAKAERFTKERLPRWRVLKMI